MIHQYNSEGLSNCAIARRLGIDRKSVKRHLCQNARVASQSESHSQPRPAIASRVLNPPPRYACPRSCAVESRAAAWRSVADTPAGACTDTVDTEPACWTSVPCAKPQDRCNRIAGTCAPSCGQHRAFWQYASGSALRLSVGES